METVKETMHESKSLDCSADSLWAGLACLRWMCEPCLGCVCGRNWAVETGALPRGKDPQWVSPYPI